MRKIFVFLANGFEEIEGLTVVDMLRRAGIKVVTVSMEDIKRVSGSHGIEVQADCMFHEVLEPEGAMFVLPGGIPGTYTLRDHEGLGELLMKAYNNEKYIAAICAAPTVLGKYHMLDDKKATCHPSMEKELVCKEFVKEPVVREGHVITSRGMGTAIPFSAELIELLAGSDAKKKVLDAIVYEG